MCNNLFRIFFVDNVTLIVELDNCLMSVCGCFFDFGITLGSDNTGGCGFGVASLAGGAGWIGSDIDYDLCVSLFNMFAIT